MFASVRIASLSALLAFPLLGCSNQSEGGRCDTNNGSDDCEPGLSCMAIQNTSGSVSLCCPTNPQQYRIPECTPDTKPAGTDAGDAKQDSSSADSAADSTTDTDNSDVSTDQ